MCVHRRKIVASKVMYERHFLKVKNNDNEEEDDNIHFYFSCGKKEK